MRGPEKPHCFGFLEVVYTFQNPSKHQHGRGVPTWNYAVVHAYGMPRAIEDPEWLLRHLTQLTDAHEAGQALPWKVTDAPHEFTTMLMNAIVGIEVPIAKLIGKWKISRNRPEPDKLDVMAGLLGHGDEKAREMASMVNRHVSSAPMPAR